MGRKRKGRDISGWLLVDKPAGMTSTAVVNKVKWALNANKAGHCGTLDPEATGVLAIALGEATKTVSYVTEALKCYRFTVRFGAATNTDDAEGEVIAESDLRPSDDQIKDALNRFIGDIEQIPPKFSAVKIDGERAYALARQGENIELASRPLFVQSLLMIDRPDRDHARFWKWSAAKGDMCGLSRAILGSIYPVTAMSKAFAVYGRVPLRFPIALGFRSSRRFRKHQIWTPIFTLLKSASLICPEAVVHKKARPAYETATPPQSS